MFIEGIGDGAIYRVKVSKDNRLYVVSEEHPLIFHQSFHHGGTFTLAQTATPFAVVANTEEILAHIQNTSTTKLLCISHVHVSAWEGHGLARVYVASTYGANGTAYTAGNHNRTSGEVASATIYNATDATMTATGGAQVCNKGLSPETPCADMYFQGSIILGLNDTVDIRFFEQAAATPTVSVCVEGFYVDKP